MASIVNSTSVPTGNSPDADESRGPVVLAVTLWMLGFSTVFVVLRCISRLGIVKRFSWDDYFIIFAWFLAFGFSFAICWGVRNGLGRHQEHIDPANELALRKSEYAFSVIYNPVLMATKTSILLFYLSLANNQIIFKRCTIATLIVVILAGLALTLLNVLQCQPVWAVFSEEVPKDAVCTDLVTLYLSSSPVNTITDLAMLFLPMPILTSMRLPRKQKIILVVTFSFGAFVAAVDVVRIYYLQQAFQVRLEEVGRDNATTSSRVLERDDFSWYASLSFMWSAIEVHVGIICACVPSLKPLAARIMPSILRDTNDPHDVSGIGEEQTKRTSNFAPVQNIPAMPPSPTQAPGNETKNSSDLEQANGSAETSGVAKKNLEEEPEIDFMEFLTTPDMQSGSAAAAKSTTTSGTNRPSHQSRSRRGSVTFQDFYSINQKKPMTKLNNRESLAPLLLVTILFLLWGFAYGLLDVLNAQFRRVVNMSQNQASALHAAYFGAYFVGPLTVGRFVFKKWGFKSTFITGLSIYAVGTIIFWPSAVLASFPAFIISNFIVGIGVSTLEVAANPFIALCGPPVHAESRLNISQGVQAIGTILAPLLAQKVLFKDVNSGPSLINVQWAYLGIALFDVILALIFVYMPVPEGTDEDFEEVAEKRHSVNSAPLFKNVKVVYVTLALGVFSNFCYVGGQEAASLAYQKFVDVVFPPELRGNNLEAFDYQTIGHTVFAVGRFICAGLGFLMRPRYVLLLLFVGMIITSALCMVLTGPTGVAMLVLYELFQSGAFPLIFAIALRGLGSHTKSGSVYLTAAISGGAIFPVIMDPVSGPDGMYVGYSFCVVVAACVAGAIFPAYTCIVPKARNQVDPIYNTSKTPLPIANTPDLDISHREKKPPGGLWPRKKKDSGIGIEHVEGSGTSEPPSRLPVTNRLPGL